jgi:WD40 repeat protein
VGTQDGRVLRLVRGETLREDVRLHAGAVHRIRFAADGRHVVTSGDDGTARVVRTDGLRVERVLVGHAAAVRDALLLPDGARVVTASRDRTVRLWDASSGTTLLHLEGDGYPFEALAVSPDGTRIAGGAGSKEDARSHVHIWTAPARSR